MARYTGMKRSLMTVPARGTASFDFTTNQPNYFRVQNRGTGRIYGSTGSMPTQNNYDFYVDGEKVKLYAQPHVSNRLYIYNPSGSDVTVVCVSFYAEFDPLAYALGDIEVTIPEVVNSSMTIQAFNAALPAGSNTIGKVGISGSIPAGSNKIGSVSVDNLTTLATLAKQEEILSKINEAIEKLTAISTGTGQYMDYVSAWGGSGNNGESSICTSGTCHILMLTNDGEADFNIILTSEDGTSTSTMALKPGETINDLKFRGTVKLDGTNYAYRIMAYYM